VVREAMKWWCVEVLNWGGVGVWFR
jgi:hypothetical protein